MTINKNNQDFLNFTQPAIFIAIRSIECSRQQLEHSLTAHRKNRTILNGMLGGDRQEKPGQTRAAGQKGPEAFRHGVRIDQATAVPHVGNGSGRLSQYVLPRAISSSLSKQASS